MNDYMPPQDRAFFAHRWCLPPAGKVGLRYAELIDKLPSDRVSERLRAAQGAYRLGGVAAATTVQTSSPVFLNR